VGLKLNEEEHENSERWMLTYLDLITLLMIFFIVMYAMSNVDAAKYEQLSNSLNSALAGDKQSIEGGEQGSVTEVLGKNPPSGASEDLAATSEQDLAQIAALVVAMLKEKGLENQVSVAVTDRGIVISLKDIVFFESGSAEIKPENANTLVEIGRLINSLRNYVRVEGNTDNVPISNSIYSNNWDLSVMRASKVLDIIVVQSGFSPEKISAIGYGEYRPVTSNDTEEGKSKNRRVDIVILKENYSIAET